MTRCAAALLALGWLGCVPVVAGQDLVAVAPHLATVEHEDARVRVVRLRIPAQASLPMHDRPRRVVVSLTPNHVRLVRPDGSTSVTRTEAGTVAWSEPAVRAVSNLGGPVENVVVELPRADAAAESVARPPPGDRDEPWRRWAFENQYVRVYDVRIPPGTTTAFQPHAFDQVSVFVSGGRVSVQAEGQAWRQDGTVEPGRVLFSGHAAPPLGQRVRNDGAAEVHVIVVQLLR